MKNILLVLSFLLISTFSFSKDQSSVVGRDRIVGNLVKNYLENYHFRKLKINDDLSLKAFEEYIKKVDYGKQLLLKTEIDKLRKYERKVDDQLISGDHQLVKDTVVVLKKRLKHLNSFRKKTFKKEFSFAKSEELELDPEKRDFPKSLIELENHWRKIFKHSTLDRYLSLVEGEKEDKKEDKKNTKKKSKKIAKKKPLTDKQMRKKAHEAISKKYKRLFTRLLKDDHDDYMDKFVNAATAIFDPHTNYLTPKKKEDFDIDISGSLEGIGAVLQEDGAYIKVVTIVPGGAAWRQKGLGVDDVILQVAQGDGEAVDLLDMRVDDAVRYIRGKKGTIVALTVKKPDGTKKTIKITRDVVQIAASYAKGSILKHSKLGSNIGYIHVPKFYRDFGNGDERNCTDDVRMEIARLKKKGINGLILDLRSNGGGALVDATKMSGLFIKDGPIVQVKKSFGEPEIHKDTDPKIQYGGPLIVMINRFSASASEILAAALQDYGRAVIVGGEYSHGKGTVQAVINFNQPPYTNIFGENALGSLKVTIQKFYRVNGSSTQYKGVTPDIIIPDPLAYAENREQDLEYSLPWDKVSPLKYSPWKNNMFDMKILKKRSEKRVKKSKRFSKITESVKYLKERRGDTKVSLSKKEVQKRDTESKKMTDKLQIDFINKEILVSDFEASLRAHEKVMKKDEKEWKQDFTRRKTEWVESLQKDTGLEEALFIIDDMIKSGAKQKLSMIK